MTTKTADSKGRVSLGRRFAGQTVIIEEIDPTEVRVTMAQVVPQRELWLHKNPKAKASVLRGLAQAGRARRQNRRRTWTETRSLAERLDD